MDYFKRKRRFTKSWFAELTFPFFPISLFLFFVFFVRICRLKAFWNVISPVPVILNLFLALEFVLTFGIF